MKDEGDWTGDGLQRTGSGFEEGGDWMDCE